MNFWIKLNQMEIHSKSILKMERNKHPHGPNRVPGPFASRAALLDKAQQGQLVSIGLMVAAVGRGHHADGANTWRRRHSRRRSTDSPTTVAAPLRAPTSHNTHTWHGVVAGSTPERVVDSGGKVSPAAAFTMERASTVVGGLLQRHRKNNGGEAQVKAWKNRRTCMGPSFLLEGCHGGKGGPRWDGGGGSPGHFPGHEAIGEWGATLAHGRRTAQHTLEFLTDGNVTAVDTTQDPGGGGFLATGSCSNVENEWVRCSRRRRSSQAHGLPAAALGGTRRRKQRTRSRAGVRACMRCGVRAGREMGTGTRVKTEEWLGALKPWPDGVAL
jgi:hypothetical protein